MEVVCDHHEDGEEDGDGMPRMGVKEEGACRGREEVSYAYSFSAPYPDLTRGQVEDGGGGGVRYLTVVRAGVVPWKVGVDEEEGEGAAGREESVHV